MTEVSFRSTFDVKYIQHMGSDEMICQAARVSAEALAAKDAKESERLIKFLADNRHGTPFEHTAMTFMVTEPIFCTREFHRHRIGWSYNEESSRWRVMEPVFYVPPSARPMTQVGRTGEYKFEASDEFIVHETQKAIRRQSENAYNEYVTLLDNGVAKEVARQLLPVNLYTSFYATCNARSLMAFLSLRMAETALWEIRQVANQTYNHFEKLFPLTAHAFVEAGRRGV